jgi:hypothetical protein
MSSYLVVRLVPESPVVGGTFSAYLDDLRLQVFDAYTGTPLSDIVYSSPYVLTQWGGALGQWISVVSVATSEPTKSVSPLRKDLHFQEENKSQNFSGGSSRRYQGGQ